MNADLISKIKALLSKTTEAGCTEAESQAAVAMANKLITQHNLSIEDIQNTTQSTDQDVWGEAKIIESGKWTLDIALAVHVVENYFFVKHIMFKKPTSKAGRGFKLCFYGKKENVITAKYVFDSLIAAFDNLWISYRKSTNCELQYKRIFITKIAEGFGDKLKIERYTMSKEMDIAKGVSAGSTALAIRNVHEQTVEKYKKTYSNVKQNNVNFSPIAYNDNVANAGYNAGRKLNVNRHISFNNRKQIE